MIRELVLFFLFFLSFSSQVSAIPPILIDDSQTSYQIGGKVRIFEDTSSSMKFAEILKNAEEFKPSTQEIPSFGSTPSAIWVSFSVLNKSQNEDWYLEVGYPTIHNLDLYEMHNDGSFTRQEIGSNVYFDNSYVKSNHMVVPLTIAKEESRTFYLRAQSRNGLRIPLHIVTMQALYEKNHPKDLVNSIYFGLIIALTIYNLFIYLNIKDITYLYYVLYIFFFGLNIAYLQGYGFEFIDNQMYAWNGGLSIVFGTLFSTSFLRLKYFSPVLFHLRWLPIGFVLIYVLFAATGNYSKGFMFIIANPAFLYTLIIGIVVYYKGFKPAKLYVFAFMFLVAAVVFFVLTGYRVFPINVFTEHIMQIGSGVEALALSLALAHKFHYYKKEKQGIQKQVLDQATEFSHQLIQSQENEKKRIAAELHDSLGQKLILLKNKIHFSKAQMEKTGGDTSSLINLTNSITDTIQEVRSISYDLRPFQLDLLGLTQSIESMVEDFSEENNIKIIYEATSIDNLFSKDNEINIYRIIQQILNNIIKNSGAKEGSLFIKRNENQIQVFIEDYGKNFQEELWEGFEFLGIKERVSILKGKMILTKAIPQGTSIEISIPYL